jgi:hypothetical protein
MMEFKRHFRGGRGHVGRERKTHDGANGNKSRKA